MKDLDENTLRMIRDLDPETVARQLVFVQPMSEEIDLVAAWNEWYDFVGQYNNLTK